MPIGRAIRLIIEVAVIVYCILALIHEYHSYTPKVRERPYIRMPN